MWLADLVILQKLNWKKMPKGEGENYLTLTGPLPDLTLVCCSPRLIELDCQAMEALLATVLYQLVVHFEISMLNQHRADAKNGGYAKPSGAFYRVFCSSSKLGAMAIAAKSAGPMFRVPYNHFDSKLLSRTSSNIHSTGCVLK